MICLYSIKTKYPLTGLLILWASAGLLSAASTSVNVLWTANWQFNKHLVDEVGALLTGGDPSQNGDGAIYQIGYFDGLDPNTDPATVGAGLWSTFTALSGDDSLNPHLDTTLGDSNGGGGVLGFINASTVFDTTTETGVPLAEVRLGLRFYNETSVAGSTHFNILTSFDSGWKLPIPRDPPSTPLPANVDMNAGDSNSTLIWQGTPFQTDLPIATGGNVIWQDSGPDWSQAASWDNTGGGSAPPGSADIAVFPSDPTITHQPDVNGTTQSVSGLSFDVSGADYTVRDTGNGSLENGADGIVVVGTGEVNLGQDGSELNLVLGADQTWDVGTGATLRYADVDNTIDFGNFTLTKAGAGTLILNEDTYNNIGAATDVVLEAGTLELAADPGTTGFNVELQSATLSTVSLLGATLAIERSAGHNGTLEVNSTLNGNITGAGDITLKKVGSGTATVASTISGSGAVIVDDANDTIRFTGANSYTGATTVTAGTLLIDGNQTSATGAVSVASGATLGGSGSVGGATTVAAGGNVTGGTVGATGQISFANGLDTNGATWLIDVLTTADHDVIDVTGNLDITGATLNVSGPLTGSPYIISSYDTLTGTFALDNLPGNIAIDYNYNGQNQIALIPEPGTVLPLAAMFTPWLMRRRRRSR